MKVHAIRPSLPGLLKHHETSQTAETLVALETLRNMMPGDEFSLSQWGIGLEYYRKRVRATGQSGGRCIDFGCGAGNWAIACSPFFDEVVAIDKDRRRLAAAGEIAKRLGITNVRFIHSAPDSMAIPLESSSVSFVVAYNVLSVLHERRKVLHELGRILSADGKMFLSFNEIGVIPFYLMNGLLFLKASRIVDITVMTLNTSYRSFLRRGLPFERTYGWMNTEKLIDALRKEGLAPVWSNWDNDNDPETTPLFPLQFWGFRFFREIIVRKV